MEKYFCHACLNTFYVSHQCAKTPDCPECGQLGATPDVVHQGGVYVHKHKVTRTWYVDAYHHQDAIDKSKNWNHCDVSVSRIRVDEPFYE